MSNAAKLRGLPKLLFVCVENSNRSQMAEAFARMDGRGRVESFSAGSRPSGRVNPKAITSMAELGYDLALHGSKSLLDIPTGSYAAVVTMGCGDACPSVPADRRFDWQIPDPREMNAEAFRRVRDLIRAEVRALLRTLNVTLEAEGEVDQEGAKGEMPELSW